MVLFQVQEILKRWKQVRGARKAVISELQAVEVILSTTLLRISAHLLDNKDAVREVRWQFENRDRVPAVPDFQEYPSDLFTRSTEDVGKLLRAIEWSRGTLEVVVPILDGALSSPIAHALAGSEIVALSELSSEIERLSAQHRLIMSQIPLTFSVTDPVNHDIVTKNIEDCKNVYRLQVRSALEHLRRTQKLLEAKNLGKRFRRRSWLWITRPFKGWWRQSKKNA